MWKLKLVLFQDVSLSLWTFFFLFPPQEKSSKLFLVDILFYFIFNLFYFKAFFRGYSVVPGAVTVMNQAVLPLWLATHSLHCQFSGGTLQMDSHG